MIGWIDNLLKSEESDLEREDDELMFDYKRIKALNVPPTKVGRGLSETLSIPSEDLESTFNFITTLDEMKETLECYQ